MKSDLDRLMEARQLDAIVIEGTDGMTSVSSAWNYITCGQKLTGLVVKKRGERAQILYHPMEQQQAEASGLEMVSYGKWNLKEIAKNTSSRLEAATELYRQIFRDQEISGRVAWHGAVEAAQLVALIDSLRKAIQSVEFVGEYENTTIDAARRTKDQTEIAAMEDVGRRTCDVVRAVIAFIQKQTIRGNVLVNDHGWNVTIGDVKSFIRRECDARDMDVGDPIFAQGRDAGIPHAHGDESAPLSLGDPIVFDIYPRCRKTGFYHDMTRTFAIGYARDELVQVYSDVKHVFDTIMREYKSGERCKKYQDRTCELFKQQGHLTVQEKWPLEEGYTHSLGHGLGLDVHEPLAFSTFADRGDTLEPGNVFTIEPGLYYPDRGIGVRLEDTIVCNADGTFRSITPMEFELVIKMGE